MIKLIQKTVHVLGAIFILGGVLQGLSAEKKNKKSFPIFELYRIDNIGSQLGQTATTQNQVSCTQIADFRRIEVDESWFVQSWNAVACDATRDHFVQRELTPGREIGRVCPGIIHLRENLAFLSIALPHEHDQLVFEQQS